MRNSHNSDTLRHTFWVRLPSTTTWLRSFHITLSSGPNRSKSTVSAQDMSILTWRREKVSCLSKKASLQLYIFWTCRSNWTNSCREVSSKDPKFRHYDMSQKIITSDEWTAISFFFSELIRVDPVDLFPIFHNYLLVIVQVEVNFPLILPMVV